MRGLRLFVRPIEPADEAAVRAFLSVHAPSSPIPAWGLLGKLLGDIVAVVGIELGAEALRVESIVVARELRRKWIGRVMMRDVEELAAKLDRRRVIVEYESEVDLRGADEFLRRVGFEHQGERWVRDVGLQR